jgi:hypothetical protein
VTDPPCLWLLCVGYGDPGGRRRRTARELDLGRHLRKGYHGPRWTPAELALLGNLADEEVARRTGRTVNAVRQQRERRGLPNPMAPAGPVRGD